MWDIDVNQYDYYMNHPGPRPGLIVLRDYINGFDSSLRNPLLDHFQTLPGPRTTVIWAMPFLPAVRQNYPELNLVWDPNLGEEYLYSALKTYTEHPGIDHNNFLCSFNGSGHVGRRMLTSALKQTGMWNDRTCTKNFKYSPISIDGHLKDYLSDDETRFYRKFLVSQDADFSHTNYSMFSWNHDRFAHASNIEYLAPVITNSYVNLVSESWSHSYQPFITEKFVYSVITRGLFVAYAQPGWHSVLRDLYGYKLYNSVFDYEFDKESNPVRRLYKLLMMLKPFESLNKNDWHDLHLMELDNIEYNIQHFLSGDAHQQCLRSAEQQNESS